MSNISIPDIDSLLSAAEAHLSSSVSNNRRTIPSVATKFPASPGKKKEDMTVRHIEMPNSISSVTEKAETAGPGWYYLPKTNLTPGLKRDLQLLRLRNALDPKVHYKKQSLRSQIPRYSHVGEVITGPTEFYSARLTRKEKQRTFADEILAAEKASGKFKSKYSEIQIAKISGRKTSYKARQAMRRGRK